MVDSDATVQVLRAGQITIPEKVRIAKKIKVGDLIKISIEKIGCAGGDEC